MTETDKKINNIRNKTKKKRDKLVNSLTNSSVALTKEQRNIICKNSANTYNTFEDKIDELFKKNKSTLPTP